MKKSFIQILQVLLGVVIGVLLTLMAVRYRESRHMNHISRVDWAKLNLILGIVEKNYVDTLDRNGMTEAAVSAALAKLDPHSVYLPPVQLSESEEELSGGFDGIGIQFNVPNDTAVVLEVIAGGPSEKVGLMIGDRLLKVDDKVIAGVKFPQDSMVRRMKGPSGTKVTITVKRGKEVIPFEITRGKIPVHSVDAAFMVRDSVGYLRLAKFSRTTYKECHEAAMKLMEQGMTHLIFDLRDNTGGYMDQALLLSNDFLSPGDTIVYIEGRHRSREVYKADGRGSFQSMGLTVLISENSASASEIFAGAIQDNDRGTVLGRRSFGKGLVQEPLYFTDGSGLRITVARYHTPSGRCIQKPYSSSEEYAYDIYYRYRDGEMLNADSVKVDKSEEYHTLSGRTVYGGGGIVPDVFVPIDTTRASDFYLACNRKATAMRFASAYFDSHKTELQQIDDFRKLERYLDSAGLEGKFLAFAASKDGLRPKSAAEWASEKEYMMTQVRALVGRYSKLGDKAFYRIYLYIDNVFKAAI
ncbi:MAG: S41 family peptidase [Bacteroidales bacterium]|nr:S41 family peptidase [Bacteroidales bacterium]